MAFNLQVTTKYSYYFDKKFGDYKIMKPILHKTNAMVLLFLAASTLFASLYVIKNKVTEARDLYELRQTVSAFVEVNNYVKIDASDINLLTKEIYAAGKKYDVDPNLIFSVIAVESSINKNAVSPMGARGLMQLLPATAKSISEELGMKYSGHKGLSDVKTNITLGTYYLSKLSEKYNNNMKLYLAAYNYGPENIDSMLREDGGVPGHYSNKIIKIYQKLSL